VHLSFTLPGKRILKKLIIETVKKNACEYCVARVSDVNTLGLNARTTSIYYAQYIHTMVVEFILTHYDSHINFYLGISANKY